MPNLLFYIRICTAHVHVHKPKSWNIGNELLLDGAGIEINGAGVEITEAGFEINGALFINGAGAVVEIHVACEWKEVDEN